MQSADNGSKRNPTANLAEGLGKMLFQSSRAMSNGVVVLNTAYPGVPHNSKSCTFVCLSATRIITLGPAGGKQAPCSLQKKRQENYKAPRQRSRFTSHCTSRVDQVDGVGTVPCWGPWGLGMPRKRRQKVEGWLLFRLRQC